MRSIRIAILASMAAIASGMQAAPAAPAAGTPIGSVTGLDVDPATGDLYIAAGQLLEVAADGEITPITYVHPTTGELPVNGGSVAVDAGSLYFTLLHAVHRLDPGGQPTVIAGETFDPGFSGDGGPATDALLWSPSDLDVGEDGDVFVADWNNGRIRKISGKDGTITTVLGGGAPVRVSNQTLRDLPPYGPMQSLSHPEGLGLDTLGSLVVADTWHRRVVRMMPGGVVTRVAGTGDLGSGGEGGPAYVAHMAAPLDAAADADGNVWIAEDQNFPFPPRVIRVDRTGILTRIEGLPRITSIAIGANGRDVFFGGASPSGSGGCVWKRDPSGSITPYAGVC